LGFGLGHGTGEGELPLALAAHFFPRVVVMDGGRIVADGSPATALAAESIRDVFGVDPALVHVPVPVG